MTVAQHTKAIRTCEVCNEPLEKWQKSTCGYRCRGINAGVSRVVKPKEKEARIDLLPVERRKVARVIITDKEQRALDQKYRDQLTVKFDCRCMKAGQPGFAEACSACTPIGLIRKGGPDPFSHLEEMDMGSIKMHRRHESADEGKLRI